MAAGHLNRVLGQVRNALGRQDAMGMADAELLERYVRQQDDMAFEALVRRHGPMVLGVCRRVLANAADAEDAFQATFLVLVRKAPTLRSPALVGNWLHGVACRTAQEALKAARRRRVKESAVIPRAEPPEDPWAELRLVLDQELTRLPTKYRAVLVLCDLEGKTRNEAANALGCPEGTVASRLAGARATLARRLGRYRMGISAATMTGLLLPGASGSIPASLLAGTLQAARLWAADSVAAGGVISAEVAVLTKGVLKTMFWSKIKTAVAVIFVVCLLGGGVTAGIFSYPAQAGQQEKAPPAAELKNGGAANAEPQGRGGRQEDVRWADFQRGLKELQGQIRSLTAEVQALRKELRPQAARRAARSEFKMFSLKYAEAGELSKILYELLRNRTAHNDAQKGTPLRFGTHQKSNALLVVGSPEDLELVEAIITRLDVESAERVKKGQ
jgi:RNA polymerase sigma factor (sigma-70 family)